MDEVNVPSEDELRALFEKGGFDAVQADAEAAADRDAKQIFSDAFAEMNLPVHVLADSADTPRKAADTVKGDVARESTTNDVRATVGHSRGGQNSLEPTCEFPNPNGRGICGEPATQVVTISGFRWSYNARACSKCADQLEKEVRVNKGRDG